MAQNAVAIAGAPGAQVQAQAQAQADAAVPPVDPAAAAHPAPADPQQQKEENEIGDLAYWTRQSASALKEIIDALGFDGSDLRNNSERAAFLVEKKTIKSGCGAGDRLVAPDKLKNIKLKGLKRPAQQPCQRPFGSS